MKNAKNLIHSPSQYNRHYSNMRGVDFTGDGSNIQSDRFAYLENLYRADDGEGAGITESIPGFRKLCSLDAPIYGIFSQITAAGRYILVHAGKHLYRFSLDERDSLTEPLSPIGSLAAVKSASFCHGSSVYFLDGKGLHCVDSEGKMLSITENKQKEVYIPTTFYNGEPLEQRNLLSIGYKEIYSLEDPLRLAYTSEGLYFEVESEVHLHCRLAGRGSCTDTEIYVPQKVTIGEATYTVASVGTHAFSGDATLQKLVLPSGVQWIDGSAFENCSSLKTAVLSPALEEIGESAFSGCAALTTLYLHTGIKSIGENAFHGCSALSTIHIDCTSLDLDSSVSAAFPAGAALAQKSRFRERLLEFALHEPTAQITDFRIGEESVLYTPITAGDTIKALRISLSDYTKVIGKEAVISADMFDNIGCKSSEGSDFLYENQGHFGGVSAILGCRVCEVFDGRVFLAGNPNFPNTVFYSSRDNSGQMNPTYFGSLNYFNDGIAGFTVKSLLAAGDSLAVFKSGDDGGGSIYYHTPESTNSSLLPKIYPVSYIHSGMAATAGSLSFYDDPVFICEEGLCALDKKNLALERSVICRSHTVNARLLTEDLASIRLAKWQNYLVLLAGEHAYLADAHQTYAHHTGGFAYEWYYLTGLGTYRDDAPVYRYSSEPKEGYRLYDGHYDEPVENETVYSLVSETETVYYVIRNNGMYLVYLSEERKGGTFSPARCVMGMEEYLFFGTESGDLCLFNNDKRGIPPKQLAESSDFDPEEYKLRNGRRIHSDFYDFDHHAPRYALATKRDNCDIPHLTKSTVKGSLSLKCRGYTSSALLLEVGTDRSGYREGVSLPGSTFSFDSLDFAAMTLDNSPYFTLSFREKEKNWIEKQVAMYTTAFRGPFGLYSVSYRYTVQGRIKNR